MKFNTNKLTDHLKNCEAKVSAIIGESEVEKMKNAYLKKKFAGKSQRDSESELRDTEGSSGPSGVQGDSGIEETDQGRIR